MSRKHNIGGRRRLPSPIPPAALTASLLGFLLCLPAGNPARAQDPPAREEPSAPAAADPVEAIPGIWIRDERLSEDPVEKLEESYGQTFGGGPGRSQGATPGSGPTSGFGRGRQGGFGGGRAGRQPGGNQDGPSTMREMARELAERLDVLMIRIDAPQLLIRNAKREDRILFLDGREMADGFGGRSRARFVGDSLEVETSSQGRQRIETFYLEGDQLVLVTDLQGGRFADLSFRTVYERFGDAPPSPATPATTRAAGGSVAAPDDDGFDKADYLPPVEGRNRRTERTDGSRSARPATIRILPPEKGYRELLSGRVQIQTLTIDPQIAVVEFLLDGEEAARSTRPPFEARIVLADPPREHTIEVKAYGARGAYAGSDKIVLNRLDPPFAVRIAGIAATHNEGEQTVRVEAGISVPRAEILESVEFYRTEQLVAAINDFEGEAGPSGVRNVAADVPASGVSPQDFVRVVARLGDGRELEDVELLQGAEFSSEINVQLVQLQVLVVDRAGNPVGGLKPEDFEVREDGETRQVENLYVSNDIPLSLGLAIDSSGSMEPIWQQTNAIAGAFFDGALTWRDQAFLVDFDSTLRLVQPLTDSKPLLVRGLDRLFPQGNTALYDAILFSLLQYGEAPGRRALVVVTDGFDSNSRSDPTRAIDFGKRLGVPVYVVAMRSIGFGPTTMEDANLRNSMRLITGPTGGRLFQIESIDQMANVFDHIEEELRRQYVLTYYSQRPFGAAVEPEVRMTGKGLKVRSALPLEAIEWVVSGATLVPAAAPIRADAYRAFACAALALLLWPPAVEPAHAQQDPVRQESASDLNTPLAHLLGPWIMNEELSEDPVLSARRMAQEGRWQSAVLQELALSFVGRLDTVFIRVEDDSVLMLDGRGETRVSPVDGAWQALDAQTRGRALGSGDTLSIETVATDWLAVDTLVHQREHLVRTTHLRSRRLSNAGVRFRTVYERPTIDSASDHPFIDTRGRFGQPATILIVPPERGYRQTLSGRVAVRTLVIDPLVTAVDFLLDGRPNKRVERPPYRTQIELGDPPREQTLEVRAHGAEGQLLGTDRLVLNRIDGPSAVRISSIRGEPGNGASAVLVGATVSPPWSTQLERVEFYRSESLVAALEDFGEAKDTRPPQTIHVEALIEDPQPNDFVRVKAKLGDGRELEDAKLLQGGDYQAEIDVHLVQVQVLVTDREGNPVSGLAPGDFEIREGGRRIEPEHLHTAHDIRLVLGLAIDSSESMRPAWRHLRHVADSFLADALAPRDSAFLVDFDDTVRLLQPLTGDKRRLSAYLGQLVPGGGTALSDGLLFSLLQFRREPGRRALVVVTDGVDVDSRSRWQEAPDIAERLRLPIYFIELDRSAKPVIGNDSLVVRTPDATLLREQARRRLRRISRQTGGRHFHIDLVAHDVPWTARIDQAFTQIEDDLRHQHVLTYYSDQPPGDPLDPDVRLTRRGFKLRSTMPLETIE